MRISDWSSDVCSSDLGCPAGRALGADQQRMVDRLVDLEPARRQTADDRPGPPRHAVDPHEPPLLGPTRSASLTAPGLSAGGPERRPAGISIADDTENPETAPLTTIGVIYP